MTTTLLSAECRAVPTLREELEDWLRIPSVSTAAGDAAELARACDWVCEPIERDGRLYARGAADDKGNFLPLLHVACELARAGELPVNVRLLVEGEEEIGSDSVLRYLRGQPPEVDAAIVFDSLMADERTPAINTGARGLVQGPVEVRTAGRDLHSGLYGGAVLNATHVLMDMLQEVLPGPDGRVREEFRTGVATPGDPERESWARLPSGAEMLAEAGAAEVTAGAAEE